VHDMQRDHSKAIKKLFLLQNRNSRNFLMNEKETNFFTFFRFLGLGANFEKLHVHPYALRTPEESLPSGAPKEEFGRMIFQKKSSLGDRTKVPRQLLMEVRRGTGTCDAPCILDQHCSSASL